MSWTNDHTVNEFSRSEHCDIRGYFRHFQFDANLYCRCCTESLMIDFVIIICIIYRFTTIYYDFTKIYNFTIILSHGITVDHTHEESDLEVVR